MFFICIQVYSIKCCQGIYTNEYALLNIIQVHTPKERLIVYLTLPNTNFYLVSA